MDGTIQNYTLDMAADTKKEPLRVKQYDTNSRQARITLKMGGEPWTIPFGCQIHINVRKTDGTLADATCTRIDEHTVLTPITEQMTAVMGTQLGELYFLGSDGDIKSQSFPVVVYEAVMDQARIESSDDFQSLQDALRDVKTSTASADRATQYATEQGDQARDAAQRAEDAAASIQVAVDAAAAAKVSETNAKTSETAAAQTKQEVTDYVEAQKAAFVGYSQRESDSKYANALTATTTGEGGVTVEDAWTAPVLGLDVAGKSEQVATTGAQLLDFEQCLKEWNSKYTQSNGRVYTVNALGTGFQNPISFSDEDIKVTLSGKVRDISGSAYRIDLLDSSGNLVGRIIKDTKSITGMASKIRLNFAEGGVGEYADIMLNAGDTALPWEPYTGGAPSPSPDYPQDIINVGTVSTGKQLLKYPYSSTTMTINGVTFTDNGDGTITANGTATKNAYYYLDNNSGNARDVLGKTVWLSGCPAGGSLQTYVLQWFNYDGSLSAARDFGTGTNFTVSEASADNYNIVIVIMAGVTANNLVFCPMLNVGDTALPWEPYTGGKPSPSVEYPAEVEVGMVGANLLNLNREASGSVSGVDFTMKNGEITLNGTASISSGIFLFGKSFVGDEVNFTLSDGSYSASGYPQSTKLYFYRVGDSASAIVVTSGMTFTIGNANNDFVSVSLRWSTGAVFNNEKFRIMLNAGDKPKSWEPYRSASAAITLTEPLRGIGEYRDRIMCRDGEWGIERQIEHKSITGETTVTLVGAVDGEYRIMYYSTETITLPKKSFPALCDKLAFVDAGLSTELKTHGKFFFNTHPDWREARLAIVVPSNIDSAEKMKGWVSELGGLEFYYAIIGSTKFEPLPSATQQALNALTTYAGTTHLTITAGGPPADVTLEYVQDTQKAIEQHDAANRQYTDNQIAAIVAALPTAAQAAIVDNQTSALLAESEV